VAVCAVVLAGMAAAAADPDRTARPPHMIVILVDDLGWRDLACQGSSFSETPHVDPAAAPCGSSPGCR